MTVAFVLFGLILALTGCSQTKDAAKAPLSDNASFVWLAAVSAGDVSGSGILYQESSTCLYVLTAAHVLSGLEPGGKAAICFFDGWEISCGDIRFSETTDLAVIEIPTDKIPDGHRALYQCVEWDKERFDGLRSGDKCTALGLTAGSEILREGTILETWIYMEDYGQYMIWADVEIQPGMSGGGLLDGDGGLVGILSGGSEDGELAAVPMSLVLQFMADINR